MVFREFVPPNAADEPRGPQAQNRNAGPSPRRLHWLDTH